MEFNPELGSGHSIFFEAFVDGGLLALAAFLILVLHLLDACSIASVFAERGISRAVG